MPAARRIATLLGLALASCRAQATATAPTVQGDETPALAIVGDAIVPLSAFETLLALRLEQGERGREVSGVRLNRYRRAIARRLVYAEQLAQACRAAGIVTDPVEVAQHLADEKEGIERWAQHLQYRGESEATLRAEYESWICERELFERVPTARVSEEEIVAAYQEESRTSVARDGWVRFASTSIGAEPPDAEKLSAIRAALRDASDSLVLAGALGGFDVTLGAELVPRERVAEPIRSVLSRLQPGELSEPFAFDGALWIVQPIDVEPPGPLPLDRVHDSLAARLRAWKTKLARDQVITDLDRDYPVRYLIAVEIPVDRRARRSLARDRAGTAARRDG